MTRIRRFLSKLVDYLRNNTIILIGPNIDGVRKPDAGKDSESAKKAGETAHSDHRAGLRRRDSVGP